MSSRKKTLCRLERRNIIKCPYEKRVYGVGYLGEGRYKVFENGKKNR